jgi:hypothetical protein
MMILVCKSGYVWGGVLIDGAYLRVHTVKARKPIRPRTQPYHDLDFDI